MEVCNHWIDSSQYILPSHCGPNQSELPDPMHHELQHWYIWQELHMARSKHCERICSGKITKTSPVLEARRSQGFFC
jgi:hypothetical protein